MHQSPIQQHKAAANEHDGPQQEGQGKSLTPPTFQLKASEGPAAPPPAALGSKSGGLPSDLVSGFAASTGHDLSDVNVVRNSDKPAQVGALAYAQGNDIHLAAGQEQHLAHEAAHIVQQREGRVQATTQVGGMAVNDSKSLESEADSMGAKAMQMKSAAAQPAQRKAAHGATQFKAIQRKAYGNVAQLYAVVPVGSQSARQWPAGVDLRVADNGHAVASVDRGQKICYLDPWVIAQSNRELAARNSGITLVEQPDTLRGQAPNGGGMRTLKKILPAIAHSNNGGSGAGQSSWQDCGRMSREVMGPGGLDRAPGAVVTTPGADMQQTAPNYQPSAQFDNALVAAGLGANPVAARAAYQAMTPAQRQAFDRRHGLNRYAAPNVGESFATENANPNFNFHWGGVIATPGGGDRVTLQNYARGNGYDSQNNLWYFEMYGSPRHAGQTWHDQWQHPAMESFTTRTSTQSLTGTTNAPGVRLVDSPANWDDAAHYSLLDNGTQVQKIGTIENDWIRVRVMSGRQTGHTGYIMAHYFTGS